ncbi:MAG: flagellin [Woeseiaceae bacterium]|nr:flagellin [Woeseiaceae bacterium]
MALTINTNVASINAQRNLTQSQSLLNQSLQRLSTGLRINSAKDDAAGLAISERFTTQIRGLNQAARNANDGISLAQTSESALAEVGNNLQRIRELAIQSANASNSASDRAALQNEVSQRLAEIDRIASQTSFNGLKTLDGSFGSANFQVGANVGEVIGVTLSQGVRTNQLGQIASESNTVTTTAIADNEVTIRVGSGQQVSIGASVSGSAKDKAAAINAASVPGLTATATTEVTGSIAAVTGGDGTDTADDYLLQINGTTVVSQRLSATLTTADIVSAINAQSDNTGVTAGIVGTDLTLTDIDGDTIDVDQTLGGDLSGGLDATDFNTAGELSGSLTLSASENINITGGTNIGFGTQVAVDTTTLSTGTIATVQGANDVINRVDAALTTVSTLRSEFGALQSRFESTITNLETVSESLTASRGRIRDADFAAETASLTKAQILQQAGVAILAQANSQPQLALSLLQ